MSDATRTQLSGTCPHCGADIKKNARACPVCGSDEETGWADTSQGEDFESLQDFDYEQAVENEFGGIRYFFGRYPFKIIVGVLLLALFLFIIIAGFLS